MHNLRNASFETIAVHAGVGDNEHLAVTPPIYQTSTFRFHDADHGARLFKGEEKGYIYTRMLNPTVEAFENAMADLENGHKGLACASGMAAIHTVLATYLSAGDHVICSRSMYGPTVTLINNVLARFGVEVTSVNSENIDEIKDAIRENTKLVYVESPGNPTLVIADLPAIAKVTRPKGIRLVVDNTFMSPALQKPLDLGADIVVHSLTKFLNGHGDVVGGAIVAPDEDSYRAMRGTLNQIGGVLAPFDAFLVHRGIKTLALRMERESANAMKIATWLEQHDKVDWVRYPGLASHPQHELASRLFRDYGGMITFELKGGLNAGKQLMNHVKVCQLAVSLGGVESLIQHPAAMTHASMGPEKRFEAGISDGLVRLSVGIEHVDDIIGDLEQALNHA